MKTHHIFLPFLLSIFIPYSMVSAEIGFEFGASGGYTDNLFFDSSRINDSYVTPYISVNIYPTGSLEVAASGSYTAYRRTADLGSGLVGAGVTYIGYSDDNPFSIMLAGEMSARRYGDLYAEYDHNQGGASVALKYRLTDRICLKSGAAGSIKEYVNAITGNNRGFGMYAGVNASLPGDNSIDIESGFDITHFPDLVPELPQVMVPGWAPDDVQNRLPTYYYSIRASRPLAPHTGLSLEYAARHFVGDDDVVTYGLSIDNLSPWTAFWEGQAVSARIKSFIIPHMIVSTRLAYRDISFMDALDFDIRTFVGNFGIRSRDDEQYLLNVSLLRPIATSGNGIATPSMNITFIDNHSTHPLYEYTSVSVSLNVNIEF